MKSAVTTALLCAALSTLSAGCRTNMPPTEPPEPTADGSPALRTDDGMSGPRADQGLSSLPDATGGTVSLPAPPLGGSGGTGNAPP